MVDRKRERKRQNEREEQQKHRVTESGKEIPLSICDRRSFSMSKREGKRVKRRREDKVSPRMVGAGGE